MYNAGDAIESAGNSTSGQLRGGFGQPGQLMYGPSSACSPDFGHRRHPGPEARRGPVGEFRGPAGGYSRPGLLAPSSVRSGQHAGRGVLPTGGLMGAAVMQTGLPVGVMGRICFLTAMAPRLRAMSVGAITDMIVCLGMAQARPFGGEEIA